MYCLFSTEGIHSKKVQFVGSVSTLVLLGVPWLFSVWGAVDDHRLSVIEGIFQVGKTENNHEINYILVETGMGYLIDEFKCPLPC